MKKIVLGPLTSVDHNDTPDIDQSPSHAPPDEIGKEAQVEAEAEDPAEIGKEDRVRVEYEAEERVKLREGI